MRFYVGTSGWRYFWNEGDSLDWYIQNTKFNSIELNSSFYRFPYPNQVKGWVRRGKSLIWSIKVNRLITHMYKLSEKAIKTFQKFRNLFKIMEDEGILRFYLLQLPKIIRCNDKTINKLRNFINNIGIPDKLAIEFRHDSCFSKVINDLLSDLGVTMVSIDSPDTGFKLFKTTDTVYLRLHGRTIWYHHIYTDKEINEILGALIMTKPKEIFIYLNNNHGMLPTGEKIIRKLEELAKKHTEIVYMK